MAFVIVSSPAHAANSAYPPFVDTSASQAANRKLRAAEADLVKAQNALHGLTGPMRMAFESTPSWVAANIELKQSQDTYNAVRDPILAAVHESNAYRSAAAERDQLDQHVQSDRAGGESDSHVFEAAEKKLVLNKTLSDAESTALAANPNVAPARDALTSAAAAVDTLNRRFEASLRTDPSLKSARDTVESATRAVTAARADLLAALQKEGQAEAQRRQRIAEIDRQRQAAQRSKRGGSRRRR